jgi:hypothetical protein
VMAFEPDDIEKVSTLQVMYIWLAVSVMKIQQTDNCCGFSFHTKHLIFSLNWSPDAYRRTLLHLGWYILEAREYLKNIMWDCSVSNKTMTRS